MSKIIDGIVKDLKAIPEQKHDKEVQNVWCHSIKADREITE